MKSKLVVAVLLLSGLLAAQGYHRHFHIHQTSLTSFVVTCDNGADPTVKGGDKMAVEITCGK